MCPPIKDLFAVANSTQNTKRVSRFQAKKIVKVLCLTFMVAASTDGLAEVIESIHEEAPVSVVDGSSEAYVLGKDVYGYNNRGTVNYIFDSDVTITQQRGTKYSSFDGTASTLYLASHSSQGNSTAVFKGNVNLIHEYSEYTGSLVSAAALRMDSGTLAEIYGNLNITVNSATQINISDPQSSIAIAQGIRLFNSGMNDFSESGSLTVLGQTAISVVNGQYASVGVTTVSSLNSSLSQGGAIQRNQSFIWS